MRLHGIRLWIEQRTGWGGFLRAVWNPPLPGGPRWRHVWLHAALFVFALQAATGLLMMSAYNPSTTTAWGSVWTIQTQMTAGWLVRGLHHFGSQAVVVLLAIHLLQSVYTRAHRPPREVVWWASLALAGVVLAACVTGWLLPWDQRGYWAVRVPINIVGLTPWIGPALQRLMLGGDEFGHATLSRFFTMHAVILPAAFITLAAAGVALRRRMRNAECEVRNGEGRAREKPLPHQPHPSILHAEFPIPCSSAWPGQRLRDAAACAVVMSLLMALAVRAHRHADALLDAPADPASADYPARPEWYFLGLFQMLKSFKGPGMEWLGAVVVPALAVAALSALPFLERWLAPRRAHAVSASYVTLLATAAAALTLAAVHEDQAPSQSVRLAIDSTLRAGVPLPERLRTALRAYDFHRQKKRAAQVAARALELAELRGIPPAGPLELLADDPVIQGPSLFAAHCAACHRYDGHDGLGAVPAEPAASSDLAGYGTAAWIRGLLAEPGADTYFGRMRKDDGQPAHTRMIEWREDTEAEYPGVEGAAKLDVQLDAVAAYLADEAEHPGRVADYMDARAAGEEPEITFLPFSAAATQWYRGREFFKSVCNECHAYRGERTGTTRAPEMFGYASVDWIARFMADPAADEFYRSAGREPAQMPAMKDRLTERERRLIAEWLRGRS